MERNISNKTKKNGLTLIELIVTITILGILSITFSNIYIESLKTFETESAQSILQTDSQTAIDRIINETKGAQKVESSYSTYTTGETVMVLAIPAIDEDQAIIYNGSVVVSDYIIYYLQSGSIHRKIYADDESVRYSQNEEDYVFATGVEDLTFEYSPAPPQTTEVTVTLTLERTIGKSARNITLTNKTKLRNKQ